MYDRQTLFWMPLFWVSLGTIIKNKCLTQAAITRMFDNMIQKSALQRCTEVNISKLNFTKTEV